MAVEGVKRRGWVAAIIILPVMWFGALAVEPLVLLFPVAFIVFLARRQKRVALVFLALSPITVMVIGLVLGVVTYLTGTGVLMHMGLPRTEFHNLDSETRLERRTGGCLVTGWEWMLDIPNNAALRSMTAVLGPMHGTYTGPYPTKDEALASLAGADWVDPNDLCRDRVKLAGREVRLDTGVGEGLLRGTTLSLGAEPDGKDPRRLCVGAIWKDRVLILRLAMDIPPPDPNSEESARIALIDCERGRPFAFYGTGSYYHRFPPVTWKK